jgi:hypothetical protein
MVWAISEPTFQIPLTLSLLGPKAALRANGCPSPLHGRTEKEQRFDFFWTECGQKTKIRHPREGGDPSPLAQ